MINILKCKLPFITNKTHIHRHLTNSKIADIIRILTENEQTISIAESCTGGMLTAEFIKCSGASSCVKGGIVAYTIEQKQALLDVPLKMIQSKGIVSSQVAIQMAKGILNKMNVDFALATTGTMGPNSDDFDTPIGIAYIALVTKNNQTFYKKITLKNDRISNIKEVVNEALELLFKEIIT